MPNSPIFTYTFNIPKSAIDDNGHVNNVAYVQWMQDVAIKHGESTVGYTLAENTTWYAREHRIEYLSPAFLGEEVELRTWLREISRARAYRRYEFARKADGKILARGESIWVYVDATTGRPIPIPAEMTELFPALPDTETTTS